MKNLVIYNNEICLIAGSGEIVFEAAVSLNAQKKLKNIILLNANKKLSKHFKNIITEFNIRELSNIIKFININQINKVLIIGYVHIPQIKEIKLSLKDKILFSKNIFLKNISDQSIILKNFLNNKDIQLLSPKNILKDNLVTKNDLFIFKEHKSIVKEIINNKKYISQYFNNSISQSLIMNGNEILAVEDVFGTDHMINRLKSIYKRYKNLIFFKSKKRNQIDEIDFPVVGLNTLKLLKKYEYKIICLFHKQVLINNKVEFLKYLKNYSISLLVL